MGSSFTISTLPKENCNVTNKSFGSHHTEGMYLHNNSATPSVHTFELYPKLSLISVLIITNSIRTQQVQLGRGGGKIRSVLDNYLRSLISFDFFELQGWLIASLSVWYWLQPLQWGCPFPSTSPLGPYLTSSIHPFSTPHTHSHRFPSTFSSASCLSGTCWVSISSCPHRCLYYQ